MIITNRNATSEFSEFLYFKPEEFACPCCGELKIDDGLVTLLEYIRVKMNTPIRITSGYRCEEYNKKIGGVENSAHTEGLAVDIAVHNSNYRLNLLYYIFQYEFSRIGIGKSFIHIDMSVTLPQNVCWTYYGKH